jgi:aminoglycoside 3-N-acetyltransferase
MNYRNLLLQKLQGLKIPRHRLVIVHVRLKDLVDPAELGDTGQPVDYKKLSLELIAALKELYSPLGILVPSFTYSFTKTGIYDRANTPGEVGRFGEEVRLAFPLTQRTMNPVFSFIDCFDTVPDKMRIESAAFDDGSIWAWLTEVSHLCLNINVPALFGTYLHYLEARQQVPYRYSKTFKGRVSADGSGWTEMSYEYYVRDLDRDTLWRREKIASFLKSHDVLHDHPRGNILLRWFDSTHVAPVLEAALRKDPEFFVSDRSSPIITERDINGMYLK